MSDERGSVTLWILGLSLALFLVGGLSLDLWRALAERQDLAGIADAAAIAAASGIDQEHWRATGEIVLDPDRAVDLGLTAIAAQPTGAYLSAAPVIEVVGDGTVVAVTLQRTVGFTLLNLSVGERTGPFVIRVEALADADPIG